MKERSYKDISDVLNELIKFYGSCWWFYAFCASLYFVHMRVMPDCVAVLIVFEWQAKRKKIFSSASNFTIDAPYPHYAPFFLLSILCMFACVWQSTRISWRYDKNRLDKPVVSVSAVMLWKTWLEHVSTMCTLCKFLFCGAGNVCQDHRDWPNMPKFGGNVSLKHGGIYINHVAPDLGAFCCQKSPAFSESLADIDFPLLFYEHCIYQLKSRVPAH